MEIDLRSRWERVQNTPTDTKLIVKFSEIKVQHDPSNIQILFSAVLLTQMTNEQLIFSFRIFANFLLLCSLIRCKQYGKTKRQSIVICINKRLKLKSEWRFYILRELNECNPLFSFRCRQCENNCIHWIPEKCRVASLYSKNHVLNFIITKIYEFHYFRCTLKKWLSLSSTQFV